MPTPRRTPEHHVKHALTDWEFMQLVLEVVEKAYGVKDVTERRRSRRISEARMIAMYLSRILTPCSYPFIADVFGRDHSTVMHSEKRMRQWCDDSENMKAVVDRLIGVIELEAGRRSKAEFAMTPTEHSRCHPDYPDPQRDRNHEDTRK